MKTLCSKVSFDFDPDEQIFYKVHFGIITISDIIKSWNIAFDQKVIPEGTKRFVLDFRGAHFDIDVNEIHQISNFYEAKSAFRQARIAVLTVDPKDFVIPILVQSYNASLSTRPFSTLKEATKWVLY